MDVSGMNATIEFFVPGLPQTAGSKKAFPIYRKGAMGERLFTGKTRVADDNPRTKNWQARVAHEGEITMAGKNLLTGPLHAQFTFYMPRIGQHYRSNGELKPNAPQWPIVRPDVLKLSRAVEDALTGICWRDDSQIAKESLQKVYDDKPGVQITITPLEQPKPAPAKEERQPELV